MAETSWQNKPIHFQYGDNFLQKLVDPNIPGHIQNVPNGIIYFDSANRQIILGQDTASQGAGSNYKIYSDLYQTLFYAEVNANPNISDGYILKILVADDTRDFLKQNMTALRVKFNININATSKKKYYLITKSDLDYLNSQNYTTNYVTEFKKLAIEITLTEDLICFANDFLDFMYTPSGPATGILKFMSINQKLNFVGEKANRLVWTNENSITVSTNHYADASHIAVAATGSSGLAAYQKILAGDETDKTDFTLLVNGKIYANQHIYTPVGFYIRRSATGGGFVLYDSAIETARLSNTTLGTATTEDVSGVQGVTTLTIGNALNGGSGDRVKGNSRGRMILYGSDDTSARIYSTSWTSDDTEEFWFSGKKSKIANEESWTTIYIGNNVNKTSTTAHTQGRLRIYGPGTKYIQISPETIDANLTLGASGLHWTMGRLWVGSGSDQDTSSLSYAPGVDKEIPMVIGNINGQHLEIDRYSIKAKSKIKNTVTNGIEAYDANQILYLNNYEGGQVIIGSNSAPHNKASCLTISSAGGGMYMWGSGNPTGTRIFGAAEHTYTTTINGTETSVVAPENYIIVIDKDNQATFSGNASSASGVTQTAITYSGYTNWRTILWGASSGSSADFTVETKTGTDGLVYATKTLKFQPSTGTIRARTFRSINEINSNAYNVIESIYSGTTYGNLKNYMNGNITINANSKILCLGYENTTSLNLMNGKGTFDTNGNLTIDGDLTFTNKIHGVYGKDSANTKYGFIVDNGSNLWIGASGSGGTIPTHTDGVYIHAGKISGGNINTSVFLYAQKSSSEPTATARYDIAYGTDDGVGSTTLPAYMTNIGKLATISNLNLGSSTDTDDHYTCVQSKNTGLISLFANSSNNRRGLYIKNSSNTERTIILIENDNTTIFTGDALRLYSSGSSYYQELKAKTTNLSANRSIYFSNYDGTAYLTHVGGTTAVGSLTQPTYVAANGRITAGNKVYVLSGGQSIPAEADLNDYTTIENYYCDSIARADSILNAPYSIYTAQNNRKIDFTLKIESSLGSSSDYLRQIWKAYNSGIEAERTKSKNNDWTAWRFKVFKTSDITTTVGSTAKPVYVKGTGEIAAITDPIASDITGNAATATQFKDSSKIELTGAVTGEASSQGGSDGWTINTTIPDNSIVNSKLVNKSITIAGTSINLGGSMTAATLRSKLGLTQALRFVGITTTSMTDGRTTAAVTIGGSSYTPAIGDVVIYEDEEYIWVNNTWERLGRDSSFALSGHVHGNITNGGAISSDTTVASGDKIVITDASDSNKIARSSITFDGSTETQGLTPKGTWVNYAGGTAVTLNNSSKAKTTASFYAPTSGGTINYVLLGNGTTAAPIWKAPQDTANILLNALGTGSSTPGDADYYISQYVGGGTTTTTYHRRPMSALWSYIKTKTDAAYKPIQSAVSNPTASGTSVTFIASITQNANGVITATRKTVSTMGAASASSAGSAGLVPAPSAGAQLCFLRGDGTWVVPTDTNTHYTTHLYAGGSGATANAEVTSGNIYLRLFDNTTPRNDIVLKPGTNISITSNANGVITFTAIDTKVTQSESSTGDWKKILLHYKNDTSYDTDVTTFTGQVYASKKIAIQPSSGNLRTTGSIQATGFISPGISSAWNTSNQNALIRQTTINGWSPIMTLKTTNGWWNLGSRGDVSSYDNHLIFGFLSDADASGVGTNHMDYSVRLIPQFSTSNNSTSYGRAFVVAPYSSNSAAVGSASNPVYINNKGEAVPGNAIPTITSGASALAWDSTVTLATIGGVDIKAKLPVNPNTDITVKQNVSTTNAEYKILTTTTASPTSGTAYETKYASGVTLNPSTSTITATTFKGNLTGNASTATNVLAYSKTLTVVSNSTDAYGWIRIATGPLTDTFGTFTINSHASGYHTIVKFTAGYCCYSDSYKQYDLSQLSCIHWRDTVSGADSRGISQIRLGVPKTSSSGTGFIDIYVPTQKKYTCTLTYKVPDNKSWNVSNSFTTITSAPDTSTYDIYTMNLDSTYSINASKGLKIGGVITQGSDKNIKHNIQNISKKYNQFYNSLQPKQFKYNQDFSNRNRFGFIAQEVEEAYKNADLDYTQDSIIEKHENNKNGEWDLNMMDIIPLNTWQIQQMKQEIELLKQELAELRKLVKKDG